MTQRFDNTDGRMRGRKLQERRFRKWTQAKGCCAVCGKLTAHPDGYQVDHKVPIHKGGPDTDSNCQVLCIQCHDIKTALDLGYKARTKIGLDGWAD